MKSNRHPLGRRDNLVVQEMDDEVLIYDLKSNKAFCLNETCALVWQACDGNKSTAEISEFVSKKLNSPANEDLVWLALDQLKKEKLIENKDDLPNHFEGMSRRDVIKKVGLTSLVAIPLVVALSAPVARASASACGNQFNDTCMCDFGASMAAGGVPTAADMTCSPDLLAMCTNAGCVCFVPAGTAENLNGMGNGNGNYDGNCT